MEVWTSLIAIIGTLAGAIVSGHGAHRAAERRDHAARLERARTERLDACLAFAEALTELHRATEDQTDHRRTQAAAEHALLRVRLLTPDAPEILAAARAALHTASQIGQDTDPHRRAQLAALAADAADAFVARAADLLH
jgi:hypothetical protein